MDENKERPQALLFQVRCFDSPNTFVEQAMPKEPPADWPEEARVLFSKSPNQIRKEHDSANQNQ